MNENYNDSRIENEIDNIIEATTQRLNCEDISISNSNSSNSSDNDTTDTNTDTNTAESNNLEIDSQNIEVFNVALHQYLKIDEEIKVLLEAIKLRNKTKKNLAETLGTYLRANEINNVKLGGTYKGKKLESKVSYSSKGFSKENVTKVLYNELKEEADVFDKIMESISKTNIITEKWNLRIISEKQKIANSKTEKAQNKIDMAEELLNEED
jgi:antitoxin component HigA of HigAB toxin-antitoxin module